MKLLLSLIGASLCISLNSQTYKIVEVTKQVTEEQSVKLNNSFRSTVMNGVSRITIPVTLPENTLSWSYMFSTKLNDDNTKMFADAAKLIAKAGAVYASGGQAIPFLNLINSVPLPTGNSSVNVYVLDGANASLFLNKKEFNYIIGGSTLQQNNGKIVSRYVPSTQFFIGVQNTSSLQRAVYVNIQLFASVKERQIVTENNSNSSNTSNTGNSNTNIDIWPVDEKDRIYNNCFSTARGGGWNIQEEEAKRVAACTRFKVESNMSYSRYKLLSKEDRNKYIQSSFEKCIGENNNIDSISVSQVVQKEGAGTNTDAHMKAINYGKLGYQFLQSDDYDRCIENSEKALGLDNSLIWVKLNIGISYLLKGDQNKATDYYIDVLADAEKSKNKIEAKSYLQDAVGDIDKAFAKKNIEGAMIIKSMLQKKIEQLRANN